MPPTNKLRSFTTAPVPGPGNPLRLAIIGDLGQVPHSEETITRVLQSISEIDAVILAGDLAYTGGDQEHWDTFFDFLDDYPVAEMVPLHICPGNHDVDKLEDDSRIFLAYEHRFRMPRIKPAELGLWEGSFVDAHPPYPLPYEYGNAYYAYTYGPARMIMLSAYTSMEPDSLQYKWLAEELESVDRSITPWLLVTIHTPFYNTFDLHRKDKHALQGKEHFEPLFVRHKVNLIFSGHIHTYQRTANVAFGEVVPDGPIYITIGAGGHDCKGPFFSEEPEPWVKVRDNTFLVTACFASRIYPRRVGMDPHR
jgi:3',5'-cyclic AMP phosphodiesterase CpdA